MDATIHNVQGLDVDFVRHWTRGDGSEYWSIQITSKCVTILGEHEEEVCFFLDDRAVAVRWANAMGLEIEEKVSTR